MFQLQKHEFDFLISQSVTSKKTGRGGIRKLPFAFTEQGVAMLSGILNSDRAILVTIINWEQMSMKKSTLLLNNITLRPDQIHKFRGFVGNLFKEHDLIHNHDLETGKVIYRYPLIQFKLIDNTPAIIAITDRVVKIFTEIFMNLNKINIDGVDIPVFEKDLKVEETDFGYSDETFMYEFVTPWLGLNQNNYTKYEAVKRCLSSELSPKLKIFSENTHRISFAHSC